MARPEVKQLEPGKLQMGNKTYLTVAYRINQFRQEHPDYSVVTEILERTDSNVFIKATISDAKGRILATGHAEEDRNQGMVNKTSAIENGETSAIGRALANLGYGGDEFCSADELVGALKQQTVEQAKEDIAKFYAGLVPVMIQHADAIKTIKLEIAAKKTDVSKVCEAYLSIPEDAMKFFCSDKLTKNGTSPLSEVEVAFFRSSAMQEAMTAKIEGDAA